MIHRASSSRANPHSLGPEHALRGGGFALVALALALSGGFWAVGDPAPLAADVSFLGDSDRDGIVDAQELILGTSPYLTDTDADGYSDAEELAMGSEGRDPLDVPSPGAIEMGFTARGERGNLHILAVLHSETGSFDDLDLRFGAYVEGRIVTIPSHVLAQTTEVRHLATDHGALRVLDIALDPALVPVDSHSSWFGVLLDRKNPRSRVAASVDLRSNRGVILLRRQLPSYAHAGFTTDGSGALYQPIPPAGLASIPADWDSELVCYRRSEVVAVVGAVVTREVVEADCIDNLDTFCEGACENAVGYTFDTIDPLVIVGG